MKKLAFDEAEYFLEDNGWKVYDEKYLTQKRTKQAVVLLSIVPNRSNYVNFNELQGLLKENFENSIVISNNSFNNPQILFNIYD